MKKILKYSIWGILAVLVLNVLAWYFHGKETVLLQGADTKELYTYINKPDTLYLFIGEVNDEYNDRYSNFKTSTIEKLANQLTSQDIVTIVDERQLPLENSRSGGKELINKTASNAFAYDVSINPKFPLIVEVHRMIWAPGFATDDGAICIWFFGWHQIKHTGVGVT